MIDQKTAELLDLGQRVEVRDSTKAYHVVDLIDGLIAHAAAGSEHTTELRNTLLTVVGLMHKRVAELIESNAKLLELAQELSELAKGGSERNERLLAELNNSSGVLMQVGKVLDKQIST